MALSFRSLAEFTTRAFIGSESLKMQKVFLCLHFGCQIGLLIQKFLSETLETGDDTVPTWWLGNTGCCVLSRKLWIELCFVCTLVANIGFAQVT